MRSTRGPVTSSTHSLNSRCRSTLSISSSMGGDQGEVAAVGGDGHGQDPALAGAEQHYWAAQLAGGPVDGVGSS